MSSLSHLGERYQFGLGANLRPGRHNFRKSTIPDPLHSDLCLASKRGWARRYGVSENYNYAKRSWHDYDYD